MRLKHHIFTLKPALAAPDFPGPCCTGLSSPSGISLLLAALKGGIDAEQIRNCRLSPMRRGNALTCGRSVPRTCRRGVPSVGCSEGGSQRIWVESSRSLLSRTAHDDGLPGWHHVVGIRSKMSECHMHTSCTALLELVPATRLYQARFIHFAN